MSRPDARAATGSDARTDVSGDVSADVSTDVRTRIAVVGGGLVGAVAALRLARDGHEVALIEPRPPEGLAVGVLGTDLRTVALSPASVALLATLGVWDAGIAAHACGYTGMEVWDGDGTGVIRFDAGEVAAEALGWIVENGRLLDRLWARLADSEVHCITGAGVAAFHLDGSGARLTLDDGRVVRTRLAIAADGGRSRLRELAGVRVVAEDTGQIAIATAAQVAEPHQGVAWQRFLDTGPLAFLPLPDRDDGAHRVSVVWSVDADRAGALTDLDDAAFAAALTEAFEARLGAVLAVDRRISFPLVQQHAERYLGPSLALVGDAAHVLHPLAGQGVNLGLRDLVVLAEELDHLRRGPAADRLGDPDLLARYERARRGDNALMLTAMVGLKRLFGADAPAVRLLRNTGLAWVDRARPLKRQFMIQALGLGD